MTATDVLEPPVSAFWTDLAQAGDVLAQLAPPPARVTGVVGPLGAVLAVVRHLQADTGPCEVVVLTPRAEVVCEPSWELVRSGSRLADAAHRPGASILVIDVPARPPLWVGPLVERLRRAGLGLVHAVIDGDPDDALLADSARILGGPLVIDLASPVGPGRLVELIDRRLPITSVRGVPLTAELVTAARCAGGH